jgi:uncharacterized membrane protein (DUF373 family)
LWREKMLRKYFVYILDILLVLFLIAFLAVFLTGGFKLDLGFLNLRMTSFRNIINALFVIFVLKFIFDPNWIFKKDTDGIRVKILKFISFLKFKKKA